MQRYQAKEKEKRIRLGITHGDLNGISYEVIIKALNDNRILDFFTPVFYGLSKVLSYNRKNLNFTDFNYKVIGDASQVFHKRINVVNLSNEEIKIEFGRSTTVAGKLSLDALEQAVADLKDNKIDVLVTGPINKENIQSEHFHFSGHTEYLADCFNCEMPLMLMVHDKLRVGTVTGHIPLNDVVSRLSRELVLSKIEILEASLRKDFAIQKPKLAVLGLNPHAGDHGVMGKEDESIVLPAITQARKQGLLAYGPFPADGFFGSSEYTKYDAILAMYHDQGLIPFKVLAFEGGVNFTAGLPIVRTSPVHGTAYDRAGKNTSSRVSIRQAMYLAVDIYRNRLMFEELNRNPLPTGQAIPSPNNNRQGRDG
ncbi:MAG: 4-hydroxythreonine-4-phosphate dehydrogenase PdxA [Bacteroidales bacterium]|nr:4-hydroxythreonine-4-phosphate dehydrogenase PdxA [Bacteroidales bacterium]